MRFMRSWPLCGIALLATLCCATLLPARPYRPLSDAEPHRSPITPSASLSLRRRDVPIRIYGPPAPVAVFGPPLSPERIADREAARRLLICYQAGCLALTVPAREEEQLRALARDGIYRWPTPPSGVTLRSPRQLALLDGTALPESHPSRSSGLASRSGLPEIGALNDALDFDPLRKPPSSRLLGALTALSARSTPQRPLELMSLLRPLYRTGGFIHVGPANPHSLGLAADIAAYDGHRVRQDRPDECVAATLSLLRDLPPGRYRLGMPKAPETPLVVGQAPLPLAIAAWLPELCAAASDLSLTAVSETATGPVATFQVRSGSATGQKRSLPLAHGASTTDLTPAPAALEPSVHQARTIPGAAPESLTCISAAAVGVMLGQRALPWPFFPAPQPLLNQGRVAPQLVAGRPVLDANGRPVPCIVRYRNEDYADESELGDPRLRHAIATARLRGVEIVALFPDGVDHIHLDVRQQK